MRPLSICILGGTGFLGTRLVARLIKDGHAVTVLSRDRELHKHLLALPGLRLHLYGKSEPRVGRKMGHYCVLSESLDEAREIDAQAQKMLGR